MVNSREFPISFIENNPDLPWDWKAVSLNSNLTLSFIEKHVDRNWNWLWISCNPIITMDFVERHQEESYKWDWNGLSLNPNITFNFIKKNANKLNFTDLSRNIFTLENIKNRQKEDYTFLEKERTLPKMVNLYIISKYM